MRTTIMNEWPRLQAPENLETRRRLKARRIEDGLGGPALFCFQTSRFHFSAGGRWHKDY
jgi:hypothetical protein